MSDAMNTTPLPRQVADGYVDGSSHLDPIAGTYLGVRESHSRLPDFSPAGQEALAELAARRCGGSTRPSAPRRRTATPSGAARGCCASGSPRSSPCTRPRRGCARSATCTARALGTRGLHRDADRDARGLGGRRRSGCARCRPRSRGTGQSLDAGLAAELHAGPRQVATIDRAARRVDRRRRRTGGGWFAAFAADGPRGPAPSSTRPPTRPTAAVVRAARLAARRVRPGRRGRTRHRRPRALRPLVALLERHRPRPGRGVRVRLVGVPPPAGRDARRGGEDPAGRRDPVGGAAPPRRARAGHRGRRRGPRAGSRA